MLDSMNRMMITAEQPVSDMEEWYGFRNSYKNTT